MVLISKSNSFNRKFNSMRVRFWTQHLQNLAEQTLCSKYDTHKLRCSRAEGDKYPGENKPDLNEIKKKLFNLYKAKDNTTGLTIKTWNEHIYCTVLYCTGNMARIGRATYSSPTPPAPTTRY